MKIILDVEEQGQVIRSVEIEAHEEESITLVTQRLAALVDLEVEEVLEDLSVDGNQVHPHSTLAECNGHGHHLRHRRVCVDVRFESEEARHHFPAKAHWSRVHKWGCKKFTVAPDACANLELHENAPDGPVLNEQHEIGHFSGCKVVWLVKPGPEPNGDVS
jgi:hypothetical protein